MTRIEAFEKAAVDQYPLNNEVPGREAFLVGAQYADANPRLLPSPASICDKCEGTKLIALEAINYFIKRVESRGPDHIKSKKTYALMLEARKKLVG